MAFSGVLTPDAVTASGRALLFVALGVAIASALTVAALSAFNAAAGRSSAYMSFLVASVTALEYLTLSVDAVSPMIARNTARAVVLPLLLIDLGQLTAAPFDETLLAAAFAAVYVAAETAASCASTLTGKWALYAFAVAALTIPLVLCAAAFGTTRIYRELQVITCVVLLLHPLAYALAQAIEPSPNASAALAISVDVAALLVVRAAAFAAYAASAAREARARAGRDDVKIALLSPPPPPLPPRTLRSALQA